MGPLEGLVYHFFKKEVSREKSFVSILENFFSLQISVLLQHFLYIPAKIPFTDRIRILPRHVIKLDTGNWIFLRFHFKS